MSKDGVPSKDIIKKIKKSHTAYSLKADQLAKLQKQGVSDSVINFMEQTHINSVIRDTQYNNPYYGGWDGVVPILDILILDGLIITEVFGDRPLFIVVVVITVVVVAVIDVNIQIFPLIITDELY